MKLSVQFFINFHVKIREQNVCLIFYKFIIFIFSINKAVEKYIFYTHFRMLGNFIENFKIYVPKLSLKHWNGFKASISLKGASKISTCWN